jgi:WD40 repeat protein
MTIFCDAFISYGRADSLAFGRKLYARLLEEGFNIWFDQNDIPLGVDFQNQIDDGIEKAHNFLFVIAPHSVNSPYCLKEIELAIKRNKRIIPLLHVEQISQETWQQRFPNGTDEEWEAYKAKGKHTVFQNMHPAIGKINWVYFREGIDEFEQSFAGLINLFRRHADYVEQHTHFLAKALEWERHQKQTNYLLIGEEKQQAQSWLKIRFKDEQPPCVPTDLHCEYITESIKNANNLMTQVFISYADADRAAMEKIRNSLRRESITVWTNTTDIQTGEVFEEAIKRGIEQADNVVYLLSPNSVTSDFCQRELDEALSHNKRIIPVLVRETPPEQLPSALRDLQYIDLTDKVKEDDYLLNESQLLRILRQDEAYYNEHKVLLTKALKWKQQHENPSILLRGYNLRSAETWLKVAHKRTQHLPTPLIEEFIDQSLRQPPAESLDVFISYSRADSDFARKLNDALQMQGKTTWFDQESIASGTDFQQEIYRGIKACNNFLFILSPRSVNSPYCKDEVEYAASLNKRFVTVLHREVNSIDVHPELAKVQWIDFNQKKRDFNANFNQLVRILDTDREHVHSHSKWLQRAIEWNEKDKSADLLLRGNEFAIAENWLKETEQRNKRPAATPLQKDYITASRDAIAAGIKRERWRLIILRSLLGLVSIAAVVAFMQWKRAEKVAENQLNALSRSSLVLNDTDLKFDALIEAIGVGGQLQKRLNWLSSVAPATRIQALTALQAAVYGQGFREQNRLVKHTHQVHSVAFSLDGKTIASASADNTIKLWSLDGKDQKTLGEHKDGVFSVAFSPEGQMIASASADNTVNLWSVDGKLLRSLKHMAVVFSVAFSPDGKTIASASADNTVNLWSIDGKPLRSLPQNAPVISVAFSPDGKTIASGCWDNTVKLWSVDGKLLNTFKGHTDKVSSVAFSPDGKTIASASYDNTVKLWSVDGKPLNTLTGHSVGVNSVAFSPDGQRIASASSDKTIKLWSLKGQPLQTLKGNTASVTSVTFSPDSKMIASASLDKTVNLWSIKGKELPTLKEHTDAIMSIAFSPDEKMIVSASQDKTIKLWNTQGQLLHTFMNHQGWVRSVAFSPDSKMIASASQDKTVNLWSTQGQLLNTLRHDSPVRSVTFSPDGKTLASAGEDNAVKLWSMEGKLLRLLRHNDRVSSIVFSPDSKTIAWSSFDATVKLISLEGKPLQTLKGHTAGVSSVAFNPDKKTIASASLDNTIKLWSLEGQLLHTLDHETPVISVAFSPDGKTIASASLDNTIKLWSLEGQLQQTLIANTSELTSFAFSPDGKTLASGSADKTVILWNLDELTLDQLMTSGCDWLRDYLRYNAPESDRTLCDDSSKK